MTNKLTITTITSLDGCRIRVQRINNQEYLCLTDLAGYTKKPHEVKIIQQWLRLKKTYQFLTEWETLNNPGFKPTEFEPKSLSVTKWIQLTGATGIITKRGGRVSGTWAHIDIATEFMSSISVAFRLYTIQELHRLRSQEARLANPEWLTCRALARSHYQLQTDAIQTYLTNGDSVLNPHYVYATEADLINKIIFGMTAQQFREVNQNMRKNENLRDFAEKNQVFLVSNLETLNSMFIAQGKSRLERFELLTAEKNRQLEVFNKRKKLK